VGRAEEEERVGEEERVVFDGRAEGDIVEDGRAEGGRVVVA
jgi:hypothetical protein